MAGNKGGRREGAGRKPKSIQLGLDIKQNTAEMVKKKMKLLSAVHNDDLINSYTQVLRSMLDSQSAGERRDAVRIITDIILKTETPKEAADVQEQKMTAEILVNKLRAERKAVEETVEEPIEVEQVLSEELIDDTTEIV